MKSGTVGHAERLAMVWGEAPPVFSIGYEPPSSDFDSGFTVLFDDAPDPDDVDDVTEDSRISWLCLHCLIEDYPEIGAGLDLAKRRGAADLNDVGEWVGRTVESEGAS